MVWPRWRVVADACSVTSASQAVAVGSSTPRSGCIWLYGARGFEGRCGALLVAEVIEVWRSTWFGHYACGGPLCR